MTVADLREQMSSAEFNEWIVYYQRKAQRQELAYRESKGVSRG